MERERLATRRKRREVTVSLVTRSRICDGIVLVVVGSLMVRLSKDPKK